MTPANLKKLMSLLLIATGTLHLVVAATGAPADLKTPLAGFGAAYSVLGLVVWRGGRIAIIGAMGVCAVGLALGGSRYLQNGGPATLLLMFLIDVAVIGAGALWIMKSGKTS